MRVSADQVKDLINDWWDDKDTQEKYDKSSQRGPNIKNALESIYKTRKLKGLDFQNFNFRGCCLSYLKFVGTNCDGADFEGAELFGSDLSHSKLSQAKNLDKAGLSGAKLCHVNFSKCNLSGIRLASTDVKGTIFSEVNFTRAIFIDTDFSKSNIEGADFSYAQFDKISFESILPALLNNRVRFEHIHIKNVFNQATSKEKGEFLKKILSLVKNRKISLEGIDLSNADLTGLDLSGINFGGVNFSGAKLNNANLYRANLSRAQLNNATLHRTILNYVTWSNCDISGADFNQSTGVTGMQISKARHLNESTGLPPKVINDSEKYIPRGVMKISAFFQPLQKRKRETKEGEDFVSKKKSCLEL